jgi:nitroreductase
VTIVDAHQLLTATRSARRSLNPQASNGSNQQAWRWVVVTDGHLRARVASLYRQAYLGKVGGQLIAGLVPEGTPERRLMSFHRMARRAHGRRARVGDPVL